MSFWNEVNDQHDRRRIYKVEYTDSHGELIVRKYSRHQCEEVLIVLAEGYGGEC